jgi:predicted RecB family nuclease
VFLIDDALHWSASDLTAAAECEYALLRRLDAKLGWGEPQVVEDDPLQKQIAKLGYRHEGRLREGYRAKGDLLELPEVPLPFTAEGLQAAVATTRTALESGTGTLFQAAFSDGEFFGYADFVERADDGWLVCDAKLARAAKPKALLQLGAYADQIQAMGLPLSSRVALLLGDGQRAEFPVADILPVFIERRARLRDLLALHRAGGMPARWGEASAMACGRCADCKHAAEASNDVILVAGLRMDQRRKLRDADIATMADLAAAETPPPGMARAAFDKLRDQATMQWTQLQGGPDAAVAHQLTSDAAKTLALLPAPSEGDLFFDFEGDPLYDEGDPSRVGLEYLWGVMDSHEEFTPIWAHSWQEEREAFHTFLDLVKEARAKHPDMHVYHYAPYETAALKRLAMRYQTREEELDDLLRSEVFVDLYATVRGSVRVSAPSYSIKKLEPLYMGDELRSDDDDAVGDGAASVVAYHEFRGMQADGHPSASDRLAALADYNRYDCLSTLRLRDWLLDRATDAGVRDQIVPRIKSVETEEPADHDPVFLALMDKSGPELRPQRAPDEQACAMLATAIDYHRRENKSFWWEHFDRLGHPVQQWGSGRDVFVVESAEVVSDWAKPAGRATNHRRTLRLTGDWAPGSKPSSQAHVIYPTPLPPGADGPDGAPHGAAGAETVQPDPDDVRVLLLTESRKPAETFADVPVALTPGAPPMTGSIAAAIKEIASEAADSVELPSRAALDLLARRSPRLRDGGTLPSSGCTQPDVVAALTGMDDSYVAIQGPPGTGKTYTGSRVIKELVEHHGWRIGVVAQSHAVVETMLGGLIEAGLDRSLVGKSNNDTKTPTWTDIPNSADKRAEFLTERIGRGCVIGGTTWTFVSEKVIERGGLDLLVIDEAGQFSLANTIGASVAARRLLLLGDPQQLPQVSQGTHAEPVDESALGWLMDGAETLPGPLGYFLGTTFRMHPELCAKVSTLSYDGRLHAAPAASARHLEGVAPGLGVVTIAHAGNQTESPEEAAEVVAQVEAHLGAMWTNPDKSPEPRPLTQHDFLVVAPYNAQVARIRRELDAAGLPDVRVGTVDKFQGKQAPITITSMTASSHGDVPRGMDFLLNRNRINVAISRAQWRAILIRSEALTAFMPSSVHGLQELGGFIGLCQEPVSASSDTTSPAAP